MNFHDAKEALRDAQTATDRGYWVNRCTEYFYPGGEENLNKLKFDQLILFRRKIEA